MKKFALFMLQCLLPAMLAISMPLTLATCSRSKPRPAENADAAILDTYLEDWRKEKKP